MHEEKIIGKHTRQSLYMTMSSIAEGVISVDKERNIVFINQAAQKHTGWNEHEAIGQRLDTVFNVISAKTREKVECHFTKLADTCEETSFSYCPVLISKSGSEKYVFLNVSPIRHENGQVSGAVITFQDVTCHRQIEEELKIERYNLRTQFQYSPAAMVIVDEDAVVQDVNDRYIDLFGNLNNSVIGRKLGESLGCVGAVNSKYGENEECSRCLIKECVLKVIRSRIPFRDVEKQYKLIQNGRPVIRNLKFNLVPINISGSTNALISVDDMTEYRIMEESLKKSRDFYLTLFDEFPAMLWRSKTDKNIDYINKKWLEFTGRSFEQELGDEWAENVHPDDAGMCVDTYTNSFDKHEPFEMEYRLKRFDGEYRWIVDRAGPYYDLDRNFAGYIGTCYDITEQKQAITERIKVELEMQRAIEATKAAYKAKSEFLANMSHEIRTPLNGIIGMLDLTMLTELSHDQMDNLSTAKTCANSLLKIINDVLDFSKMEAGKLMIEYVEFNFKALMEKIAKVHYYQAKEKGIELTYQLPVDLPPFLVGDPNRLQQVLNNLLSNAVKFTDRGYVSLVIKTVNHTDSYVILQFSVIDTGIGISSSEMDKLFKSFSQVDASQTRKFGGTGLGLVISRQLTEMMGGTLKVESEKEKGSTFSLALRFEVGERNRTVVDSIEYKGFGKAKKDARILLVEDDKVNQTVISRMLKEMGYKYDIAGCGNDALNLLEHSCFDLCLMDIQMPGLDGIQTAGVIRQNEQKEGRHMPIVAITAHALQGDRERFLETGMDEYISKPFQMSELFILIERLLAVNVGKNSSEYDMLSFNNPVNITKLNSYIKNYAHEIKPIINEICSNIDKLKHVIKAGNMQGTEEIAHDVKTLASSISADKMKTLAFRIELAARRGNQLEAAELFENLDEAFEKYKISINEAEDSV